MFKLLAGLIAGLCVAGAQAAAVSGDFRTESNLPMIGSGQPLVYQNLGQSIGGGDELTSAHFLQNPTGWGGGVVFLDYDPSSNILNLKSQDTWDFQTFDAYLNNVSFSQLGEAFTGLTFLGGELTQSGILPSLSFTNDSLHISYSSLPGIFLFSGGTASFLVSTSVSPVPEPEMFLMLGGGLLMVIAARRRKGSSSLTGATPA